MFALKLRCRGAAHVAEALEATLAELLGCRVQSYLCLDTLASWLAAAVSSQPDAAHVPSSAACFNLSVATAQQMHACSLASYVPLPQLVILFDSSPSALVSAMEAVARSSLQLAAIRVIEHVLLIRTMCGCWLTRVC